MSSSPEAGDLKGRIRFGYGDIGGTGNLVDYSRADEFVEIEAWAHACPSFREVVRQYGAEWVLERYVSCNEVYRMIYESALELNPKLAELLITPVLREANEPAGSFEEGAVPPSHLRQMSPLSTGPGYSISRVLIEAFGRDEKDRLQIDSEKLPNIVNMIDDAIRQSSSPEELLVRLAQGSVANGANPLAVLGHMFAQGIIVEENCVSSYRRIEGLMPNLAPDLWTVYSQMTPDSKRANDMYVL